MDERMYETVHGVGKVQKGVVRSSGPGAPKEPACPLGGLELGMLVMGQYDGCR